MKAVKVLAAAAVALLGTSAFAEFKASGYVRSGVESTIVDDDSDADPTSVISTAANGGGKMLGLGADETRFNLDWTEEKAGASLRYTNGDVLSEGATWFNSNKIDYAFAYVNLFDNLLKVSAGKNNGGDAGTEGDAGYDFGGLYGARFTVTPIDGLTVEANISTNNRPTDKHATLDALSAAAKYANDTFSVQAGYAFNGNLYAGFSLYSVENLELYVEANYIDKDIAGFTNKDGEAVASTVLTETVSYTMDTVKFGLVAYQDLTEDNDSMEFYPYVEVKLDNVMEGLSAGVEVAYLTNQNADDDALIGITPEATITVADNAKVQAFYTFGKLDEETTHVIGLGVKYEF
ncbi:hypothetical protein [Treponema sp.]|uniref:hypothetical protein n=1 Tax=Treponema sp. TaxID=166 RepID=UPI0025E01AB9|nr:hypothetical protein [Treponema sp.]MCR5217866.1 hypothetical protein [Treponema sp.]